MSNNLTFKLILDGDNKGLVSATKQSQEVTTKVFETINLGNGNQAESHFSMQS